MQLRVVTGLILPDGTLSTLTRFGGWRAALAAIVGLRILDIMAEKKTWLDGPSIPGENDYETPGRWPGEKLGLPERGAGALAPVSRRAGAVLIDWLLCYAAAAIVGYFVPLFGGVALLTYVLWVLLGILGGWLFARTPGMALRGMGVARLDAPGERVGFWRAAVRTLLTAFIFPAALVDMDGRGMHDRATGTVVIYA